MQKIYLMTFYNDHHDITLKTVVYEDKVKELEEWIENTYFVPTDPMKLPTQQTVVTDINGIGHELNISPFTSYTKEEVAQTND